MSLCQTCSDEHGIGDPSQVIDLIQKKDNFAKENSPLSLHADSEGEALPIDPALLKTACPTCEFTAEDFSKVGRLGCPSCYLTFDEELRARLSRLHKGINHKGHIPSKLGSQFRQERALQDLQEQLDQAIAQEDYEKAGELNKKIEACKKAASLTESS